MVQDRVELDIEEALRRIDAIEAALTSSAQSFKVALAGALDLLSTVSVGDVDASNITTGIDSAVEAANTTPTIEADTSNLSSSIDGAVAGADHTVNVDAVTDQVTADIEAAVAAANTTVDISSDVDTTGIDSATGSVDELGASLEQTSKSLFAFGGDSNLVSKSVDLLGNAGFNLTAALKAAGPEALAVTASIGALSAVALGGLKHFSDLAGEIRQFQTFTGAGAEEASRFVVALNELGVDSTAVGTGIFRLSQSLATGTDVLGHYGIEVAKSASGNIDLTATFLNVSDAVASTANPVLRNQIAFEAFGRAGKELLPVLKQGREGLQQFLEIAGQRHQVFTQEDLQSARDYDLAIRSLHGSIDALEISIGKKGAGPLADLFKGVSVQIDRVTGAVDTASEHTDGWFKRIFRGSLDSNPLTGIGAALVDSGHKANEGARGVDQFTQSLAEMRAEADRSAAAVNASLSPVFGLVSAQQSVADAQRGVRDAEEAVADARRGSGGAATKSATERALELRQAEQGVVEAHQSLEDATTSVGEAQQKLNDIFVVSEEETRAIADAQRGLEAAQRGYKDATDRVTEAQQRLADVTRAATALEADKARRDVARAELSEADAIDRLEEAQKKLDAANLAVQRSQGRSLTVQGRAAEAASDAQRDFERAQLDVADAADRAREAHAKSADELDGTIGTAEQAKDAQKALDVALQSQADAAFAVSDAQKALDVAQQATQVSAKELADATRDLERAQTAQQAAVLGVDQAELQLAQTRNGGNDSAARATSSAHTLRNAQEALERQQRTLADANAALNDRLDGLDGSQATLRESAENLISSYREMANTLAPDSPLRRELEATATMFETRLHDVDISVNADTSPARKSINQLLLDLNKILPGIPLGIPGGDFIPGAMAGINDFRGGLLRVGERGPETLYIPPNPGATVIPNNQSNAPGTVIHQTINVTEAAVPGDVTAFKIASILGERGMR